VTLNTSLLGVVYHARTHTPLYESVHEIGMISVNQRRLPPMLLMTPRVLLRQRIVVDADHHGGVSNSKSDIEDHSRGYWQWCRSI